MSAPVPAAALRLAGPALTPCFVRGTLIDCGTRLVAIERLAIGDPVLTEDRGVQRIRWIGQKRLSSDILDTCPHLRPIRIRAGALGQRAPGLDLDVSPQHRILLRSDIAQELFGAPEVLIQARHLVGLEGVEPLRRNEPVEYFHLLFDHHEILFANGARAESLLAVSPSETGRWGEGRRAEVGQLFPDFTDLGPVPAPARPCVNGPFARELVRRLKRRQAEDPAVQARRRAL